MHPRKTLETLAGFPQGNHWVPRVQIMCHMLLYHLRCQSGLCGIGHPGRSAGIGAGKAGTQQKPCQDQKRQGRGLQHERVHKLLGVIYADMRPDRFRRLQPHTRSYRQPSEIGLRSPADSIRHISNINWESGGQEHQQACRRVDSTQASQEMVTTQATSGQKRAPCSVCHHCQAAPRNFGRDRILVHTLADSATEPEPGEV